ncbi:MAG: radical SAM protein [Bacteroidota bacterium]
MATFLFEDIIFGPVSSRRLGVSLGINLLPNHSKFCNFNCIYCECGWTLKDQQIRAHFHSRQEVKEALESKLDDMKAKSEPLDVITYAGNGEPTLHPKFSDIINDTIALRNQYFPEADIAVLSNGTKIGNPIIFNALDKIEKNILKLDAGTEQTCQLINQPINKFDLSQYVENLKKFNKKIIIQSLFLKGFVGGNFVDNSTDQEVDAWLKLIKEIEPSLVMIYTYHRDTPADQLEKISLERLEKIAREVEALGIDTQVSE